MIIYDFRQRLYVIPFIERFLLVVLFWFYFCLHGLTIIVNYWIAWFVRTKYEYLTYKEIHIFKREYVSMTQFEVK